MEPRGLHLQDTLGNVTLDFATPRFFREKVSPRLPMIFYERFNWKRNQAPGRYFKTTELPLKPPPSARFT